MDDKARESFDEKASNIIFWFLGSCLLLAILMVVAVDNGCEHYKPHKQATQSGKDHR